MLQCLVAEFVKGVSRSPGWRYTSSASFQGTPHRLATVAVRYAKEQLSTLCGSCQATSSITSSHPLSEIASPARFPSNSV